MLKMGKYIYENLRIFNLPFTKRAFQNLLFLEGIIYNWESGYYRPIWVNSFFSPIPRLAKSLGEQKSGDSIKIDKIPAWVEHSGIEPLTS